MRLRFPSCEGEVAARRKKKTRSSLARADGVVRIIPSEGHDRDSSADHPVCALSAAVASKGPTVNRAFFRIPRLAANLIRHLRYFSHSDFWGTTLEIGTGGTALRQFVRHFDLCHSRACRTGGDVLPEFDSCRTDPVGRAVRANFNLPSLRKLFPEQSALWT